MTPATFSPSGKAQRALERLTMGEASLAEMRDWAGEMTATQCRKYVYLMGALLRYGFVTCQGGIYRITDRGRAALVRLQSGEAVVCGPVEPNARVFDESSREAVPGNRTAAAA